MASLHISQGQSSVQQLRKPNAFDALMKKPSSATQLRPGPLPKPIELRSVRGARISKSSLLRSPKHQLLTHIPHIDEESLFTEFEAQRAAYANALPEHESPQNRNDGCHEEDRRRVSYTREQKLAAVSYAMTTRNPDLRTGELKPISKYLAAKNLKITIPMLKNWMANQVDI
ncbi:hypothetical protein HO173_003301 [Letharia columbiana]|uniref:Uncharacterized protein n=1 Tax=Letharia columbiana TaxID=112416 RepID=A0A8H6G1I4_9LECA|nr:uncharacterized protein HO173_003301 [Letharia columbiana]KAF6238794.1 hypothetical protein HO173_003301 [Letharia columbiana]